MPDAVEQMMQQRPGIAEYDEPADEARSEGLHVGIGAGPRRRRDQPPRQQQGAEIERDAGCAMDNGHRHRQGPAIGLQMRRKRSFDPGGHGGFEGGGAGRGALRGSREMNFIYELETVSATAKIANCERWFTL